jgi:TonB-dependent SusC/RagA subfamily outer membrane receptor
MNKKRVGFLLKEIRKGVTILALFSISLLSAQSIKISGTISDNEGNLLFGASVSIKNKNDGVISDLDGKYTITANKGDELIFRYLGFTDKIVKVTNLTTINVILNEDIGQLEEIVVVGYGKQKKESVVGAISQLDGGVIAQRGTTSSLTDALSGAIPGVTVLQSTGIPGGSPNSNYGENSAILIRGRSTFNAADSAPLVLVDGVERQFNDIDPNDIENISVLKDASATAVFGVKGGNGVILITTKRGKTGEPVFKVDYNHTLKAISRIPKVLEGYTSTLAKNRAIIGELATNPQSWSDYTTDDELDFIRSGRYPFAYPNQDWQDIMLNDFAESFKFNMSVSGGSDFITRKT